MESVKITNKNKIHHCHICLKNIRGSTYKYNSHLFQHNAVPARFECQFCMKKFFRRHIYDKHMEAHAYDISQRRNFICDLCTRGFVYKNNLMHHLIKRHQDVLNIPRKTYTCLACGTGYCEERLLKYHIRKQHFNLHENEPKYVKKKVNETWVEPVSQSNVFVEMTKINNNVIQIKKCNVKIKLEPDLAKDDEKSGFEEYMSSIFAEGGKSQYTKAMCDYCKKEMLKKSLVPHIRERHLKLRRFKCNKCEETFNRRYQMRYHNCGKFKRKPKK